MNFRGPTACYVTISEGSGAGGAKIDGSICLWRVGVTSANDHLFPSNPSVFCVSENVWAAGKFKLDNVLATSFPDAVMVVKNVIPTHWPRNQAVDALGTAKSSPGG